MYTIRPILDYIFNIVLPRLLITLYMSPEVFTLADNKSSQLMCEISCRSHFHIYFNFNSREIRLKSKMFIRNGFLFTIIEHLHLKTIVLTFFCKMFYNIYKFFKPIKWTDKFKIFVHYYKQYNTWRNVHALKQELFEGSKATL